MKKVITILALLLIFATIANAQFGVKPTSQPFANNTTPAPEQPEKAKVGDSTHTKIKIVYVKDKLMEKPEPKKRLKNMTNGIYGKAAVRVKLANDLSKETSWWVEKFISHVNDELTTLSVQTRGDLVDLFLDTAHVAYEEFTVEKNEYKMSFRQGDTMVWRALPAGTYAFFTYQGTPFLEGGFNNQGSGNFVAIIDSTNNPDDAKLIADAGTKANTKKTNGIEVLKATLGGFGDSKGLLMFAAAFLICCFGIVTLHKAGFLGSQNNVVAAQYDSSSTYKPKGNYNQKPTGNTNYDALSNYLQK